MNRRNSAPMPILVIGNLSRALFSPSVMEVADQFIIVIVYFEAVPNVCASQCSRHTSAIFQHLLKCARICIELRITEIATILLKRKVLAIFQSN